MTLLETILIAWFSGGLLVSLLIGARGLVLDVWCRSVGRRERGADGGSHGVPVRRLGR